MTSSDDRPEIFLQATFIAVLSLIVTSAVFGAQTVMQNQPLAEVLSEFFQNASTSVSETIANKQDFIDQFIPFKQEKDSELALLLDQMATIINSFAQNQDGLQVSSEKVVQDFDELSKSLNQLESQYPRFQDVEEIIKPQIDDLVAQLKFGFPTIGKPDPNDSPLSHFTRFFQEIESANSFRLGSFFRIEPLETETRLKILKELSREITINGVAQKNILFQQVSKFKNDVLVFHRVIENDQIVEQTIALDDISIFHGLPDRMRQDGVDERLIRFVEENIKLMNFHLIAAFEQQGLQIDINHPQISVPTGYTPSTFITNLIQIIFELSAASTVSAT